MVGSNKNREEERGRMQSLIRNIPREPLISSPSSYEINIPQGDSGHFYMGSRNGEDIFITIDSIDESKFSGYSEDDIKELYLKGEQKLFFLQRESLRKMFKFVFGI